MPNNHSDTVLNNWLARIARRMDWARMQVDRQMPRCAIIDPTAVLHPEAHIENILRQPEAIAIGAHTHIRGQLQIFWNGGKITIGEWCYIGEGSRIWSQASVTIGNHVLIAHLVDIHDTNSHPIDWRERRLDSEAILSGSYRTPTQTISAPVTIEDVPGLASNPQF